MAGPPKSRKGRPRPVPASAGRPRPWRTVTRAFTSEQDVFRLLSSCDTYRQGYAVAAVFAAVNHDAAAGLTMAFHHAESTYSADRDALITQLRQQYFDDDAERVLIDTSEVKPTATPSNHSPGRRPRSAADPDAALFEP
jgi:hypothetical protein